MFYNREFFFDHEFKSEHFHHKFLDEFKENYHRDGDSPNNSNKLDVDEDQPEPPDFASLDEYKFENDRHRVIVALLIAEFFLSLMKHLKYNHVIQFIYVSQLVVDANGVLVLLKFLNQDFAKVVDFSANKLD